MLHKLHKSFFFVVLALFLDTEIVKEKNHNLAFLELLHVYVYFISCHLFC